MPQDKTLAVAVIGLGHLHPRLYMPLFAAAPGMTVTACVEADPALRDAFCRDFEVAGYATVETLLSARKPDIAAIFLPHADCPQAARLCAEAGSHLMVEKPMAADRKGAEDIVTAAASAGVHLTTGYCWRLHPVAREIKRLIGDGVIGDVIAGNGRCAAGRLQRYIDGHAAWMLDRTRSGGGPMYNLGVHWIDLYRWMLEDEAVAVCGQNVTVNAAHSIEDNSFAQIRFAGGAIVALDISYTVPDAFPHGRDLYISLRGTRGVISWAPAYEGQSDVLFVCSDDPAFRGSPRRNLSFELEPVPGYSGYMGREYVIAFGRAVRGQGALPVTGRDGVAALKVVEAVYRSAEEQRWVEIKA